MGLANFFRGMLAPPKAAGIPMSTLPATWSVFSFYADHFRIMSTPLGHDVALDDCRVDVECADGLIQLEVNKAAGIGRPLVVRCRKTGFERRFWFDGRGWFYL